MSLYTLMFAFSCALFLLFYATVLWVFVCKQADIYTSQPGPMRARLSEALFLTHTPNIIPLIHRETDGIFVNK